MQQRGQPAFLITAQQTPIVQRIANALPTVTAKILRELARIRCGIGFPCFPGKLNTKSRGERSLRNERRSVRIDKRTPALFEILRVERAAAKLGQIKIGTKQPRREARIQ